MKKNQKAPFFSPTNEQESLQSLYPALAQEWDPSKNGGLTTQEIKARACMVVWWLCPKGHSYQTMVYYRTVRGWGCLYCSGRRVSTENSLKTINPGLVQDWHPTLNGNLTPEDVTRGSSKVVWWLCKNGHEWRTKISRRSRGTGCPHCPRKPKAPEKSLLGLNPALAKEWHPDKNGTLIPSQISGGSSWKAWWKCDKGHEWEAMVHNRNHGSGCPYCDGRRVYKETRLATLYPKLVQEWHKAKNGELTPQRVTSKSIKKVWWRCREGHEWEAKIANRSKNDKGCPICSSRAATLNNCLLTTHPSLAKEWDPKKNGLTPRDVTAGSLEVVRWICKKGHTWRGMVAMRTKDGLGCPECGGTGPKPR